LNVNRLPVQGVSWWARHRPPAGQTVVWAEDARLDRPRATLSAPDNHARLLQTRATFPALRVARWRDIAHDGGIQAEGGWDSGEAHDHRGGSWSDDWATGVPRSVMRTSLPSRATSIHRPTRALSSVTPISAPQVYKRD